jgi:hypothetical protein
MKEVIIVKPKLTHAQINLLVAVKKWMDRIVDRMPELPSSFMDNTDPTPLAKEFRKLIKELKP